LVYKKSELKLTQQNPWHIPGADTQIFFLSIISRVYIDIIHGKINTTATI